MHRGSAAHQSRAVRRGDAAGGAGAGAEQRADTTRSASRCPSIVNGRIEQPGDVDVFSFDGPGRRPGRRRGPGAAAATRRSTRCSSSTDAAGKRWRSTTTHDDKGAGLITHQADSLLIGDAARRRHLLRARRRHAARRRPGLRLPAAPQSRRSRTSSCAITPSTINAAGGTSVPIDASVRRGADGFAGDVTLALQGRAGRLRAERRASCRPASTRCGSRSRRRRRRPRSRVAPADRGPGDDRRQAGRAPRGRAAEDMMQAFAYRHLVPADDLRVCVIARGAARVPGAPADREAREAGRRRHRRACAWRCRPATARSRTCSWS